MAAARVLTAVHPTTFAIGATGISLALLGVIAFNLGYLWLYGAFLPLLSLSLFLSFEIHEDFFLSLLLFAVMSTALYSIGLFTLPLVTFGILLCLPVVFFLWQWRPIALLSAMPNNNWTAEHFVDLYGLLMTTLFARYLLYRAGGGAIPLHIGELESLTRFLMSEVGGWVIFALGYGVQRRSRYGNLSATETGFTESLSSLLATGLFLVSPHVAIMTLGLNFFGITGLYVGSLPVGAAHILMRTLTFRRLAIEQQNLRLQQMNVELARSERLAAIGEMSSAISHQLLQKVGLVGLQSTLLSDILCEDDVPAEIRLSEGRERVEQLDASIADLNATLADLLIFSKDVSLHLDLCSLSLLVHEAVAEIRTLAERQGVTIVDRLETGKTVLSLDRIKLKQALLNLLTNALEASRTNGCVELRLWEDVSHVWLSVTDDGPGISEHNMERIFSPFFSTKAQGTGLGLTFAQKIISLHGGRLTAANNERGGATFVIALPKQRDGHG
jgi:signal transduction histidine kinase